MGIDEDINVCNDEQVKEVSEDFIDERLEDHRCVSKALWHDLVFTVLPFGEEGNLPFITFSDVNEDIGASKIKFGEDMCLTELFYC